MRFVTVVITIAMAACGDRPGYESSTPISKRPSPVKSPEEIAAEAKATADRRFDLDARVYAEMAVHKALIQQRGGSLPEHWKESGEVIKREGNRAIVLVRGGIKEGIFSELVVLQSYAISVEIAEDGQHYTTTEALLCKDQPSSTQIAILMVKGKWPSAMEIMNKPAKRKRRASVEEESGGFLREEQ